MKTTSGLSEKLRNDVEQPEVTSQTSTSTTFSLGITEEKPFHPQTEYVFPKSRSGDKLRSCQAHWFIKFPWLHYDEKNDSVLCFYCHCQEKRGNLKDQRNKEEAYISKGFSNWKKAPKCFYSHQESSCHQASSVYYLVLPDCGDVGDMIDVQ